jgi:acyl-CoA synthetase (NDP forming)
LANHEEELADYSKVLSREPPAVNPRMAIVTCAGGYGIIALDLLSDAKYLKRAELSADTVSKIRKIVPSYASLSNPIDLTASADNGMIANTLKCLENDSHVGIIFTFAFFAPSGIDLDLIDILAEHRSKTKKPFIVCVAYGPYTNELARRLYQKGVVAFTSLSRAMKAMDILAERAIYLGKQQIP